MLTRDERKLLNHFLDALDRLYDRQTTVIDLHALLEATAIALKGKSLQPIFIAPLAELKALVFSGKTAETKHGEALNVTDDLRQFIADQLRLDEQANPKQRH